MLTPPCVIVCALFQVKCHNINAYVLIRFGLSKFLGDHQSQTFNKNLNACTAHKYDRYSCLLIIQFLEAALTGSYCLQLFFSLRHFSHLSHNSIKTIIGHSDQTDLIFSDI